MDPLRQALCGARGVVKTTRPTTYETVLKYARNKFAFHANVLQNHYCGLSTDRGDDVDGNLAESYLQNVYASLADAIVFITDSN